ncbi:MAG: VCBS repeat-containing protein [Polyangia bacterium]
MIRFATIRNTIIAVLALALAACGGEQKKPADDEKAAGEEEPGEEEAAGEEEPGEKEAAPAAVPGRTLLVTESQFKANEEGKYTVPEAAVMLLLEPAAGEWEATRIEDTESNVFHKALPYGDEGILTLGAEEALLKLWTESDGDWKSETLWHPDFGGEHNRLRDFEIADLDGDGTDDLAIATHDQGVVAVVWRRGEKWEPQEIAREKDTFVHEIEIGDLDGDGKLEIYATPSQPNTASGVDQGGKVLRFEWNGKGFDEDEVVSLDKRHIKEILVADVEGDGTQELYAAVEAEMGEGGKIVAPVEIRRYDWKDGELTFSRVTGITDRFCRFLVAGDVDGDGADELIATAFSAGVWVIEKQGDAWKSKCIDADSGGFEHASYLADIDGDGTPELYVADDNGGVIRRYVHAGGKYAGEVIHRRDIPASAMVWNITVADL